MATDGSKLTQLPELTTLSDATMFYAVDGGEDYHVNSETIKDAVVPDTFTGATASEAGTSGLVPAPSAGNNTDVLQGDGTWTNRLTTAEFDISDIKDKAEETIYVNTNGKFYVYVEEE